MKITFLERGVSAERNGVLTEYGKAILVFTAAVVGASLVHLKASDELGAAKLALTICTAFCSLLGTIPMANVWSKRLRIEKLSYLKSEYVYFQARGAIGEEQRIADEQRIAEADQHFSDFFGRL